MEFSIPAEYAELQKNLTDFIDRELRPLEEEQLDKEKDDVPVELRDRVRRRSAELGFYAADFPEDLGGSGLPQLGMVLLREAGARAGSRLGAFTTYGPEGPTGVLLNGTDEQKKKYLTPLITAEKSMCFALTEPDAGSDAQNITHHRDQGRQRVGPQRHEALHHERKARRLRSRLRRERPREEGPGRHHRVHRREGNARLRGRARTDRHGRGRGSVRTDLRQLPRSRGADPRRAGAGRAWASTPRCSSSRWAGCRSRRCATGSPTSRLQLGIEYAKNRKAFDRPIGKNQYVQGHIVDSLVELKASKLMTYECAWKYDHGRPGRSRSRRS